MAVVALLALAERGGRWLLARWVLPTRGAQWIWAPVGTEPRPLAFYAARDFDVAAPPHEARLLILGDEEYRLFLNAKVVGSNRYTRGAALDEYDVSTLVHPGKNRLVVEVRSRRGVGGLVALLQDAKSADPLVVTDGTWRVFRRHRAGLLEAWLPLEEGEEARVWQSPPTGRWGFPRRNGKLREAPSSLEAPVAVVRISPSPNGAVLLDWGREVRGYLDLSVRTTPGKSHAIYTGLTVPDPAHRLPDTYLVPMAGRALWRDSVPRSTRYVVVTGVEEVLAAGLIPVKAQELADPPVEPEEHRGLLGLDPPVKLRWQ